MEKYMVIFNQFIWSFLRISPFPPQNIEEATWHSITLFCDNLLRSQQCGIYRARLHKPRSLRADVDIANKQSPPISFPSRCILGCLVLPVCEKWQACSRHPSALWMIFCSAQLGSLSPTCATWTGGTTASSTTCFITRATISSLCWFFFSW